MNKIKIVFVVSSCRRSGPTTQLFYIISNLDRTRFEPILITLSDEPDESLKDHFINQEVNFICLNLSRAKGFATGKAKLRSMLDKVKPDVVHSQGIRADGLLSKLDVKWMWLSTIRNYPFIDYPMKYGGLLGYIMAIRHLKHIKTCRHVVACSNSISELLALKGVQSISIVNGVEVKVSKSSENGVFSKFKRPIFITAGSLIKRKNTLCLIEAFNQYFKLNSGTLVILGDGPERRELERISCREVHFCGFVNNVSDYLLGSDIFVSASYSEGMPNSVLEALAVGKPVLLSNIPSHLELSKTLVGCDIFELSMGLKVEDILRVASKISSDLSKSIIDAVRDQYSAEAMSRQYQELYTLIAGNSYEP